MRTLLLVIAAAALGAALACGAADFDPASKIGDAVRVLALKAEPSYARPGETVTLELLAVDNRARKTRPMRIYWLPLVCINPPNDAYYACFTQLAGGASTAAARDGGAPPVVVVPDGGVPGALSLRPGVDLSPFLIEGREFSFRMPSDVLETHAPTPGAALPYGMAVVFNVACAGHVEIVDRSADGNPQASPVGCFDDDGKAVPPEDYVIGFGRVYAYGEIRNQAPVIDRVTFDGAPADLAAGVRVDRCVRTPCPKHKIDVDVPESSQETRAGEGAEVGSERLWATYYVTDGKLTGEARILYDSEVGKIDDRAMEWEAPAVVGEHRMWIVVKDNRGGTTWAVLPLVVK